MYKSIKQWLTPLLFLLAVPSYAEQQIFKHSVSSIFEDQLGYIWMYSSAQGAVRYDGKNILRFSDLQSNEQFPLSNIDAATTYNDVILFQTISHGLIQLNPATFEYETLLDIETYKTANSLTVIEDTLYIAGHEGIRSWHFNERAPEVVVENSKVYSACRLNNKLIFTSEQGLSIFDHQEQKVIYHKPELIVELACGEQYALINNYESSNIIDEFGQQKRELPSKVNHFELSAFGDMVYAVDKEWNIQQIDLNTGHATPYKHTEQISKKTNTIFVSSSNILFSLASDGVYNISNTPTRMFESRDYAIAELAAYEDSLLLGTKTGRDAIIHGRVLEPNIPFFTDFHDSIVDVDIGLEKRIMDLDYANGHIYIASAKGFYWYDTSSGVTTNLIDFHEKQFTHSITVSDEHVVLGSDYLGVLIYDTASHQLVWHLDKYADGTPIREVAALAFSENNKLIFSGKDGLYLADLQSQQFSLVYPVDVEMFWPSSVVAANNKIYLPPYVDKGSISVLDKDFELINELNVSNNKIQITKINDEIWGSHIDGVFQIDTRSDIVKHVPSTDGYQLISAPVKVDNRIWVGSAKGVLQVSLDSEAEIAPKVYISHARINGEYKMGKPVYQLPSEMSSIELNLASLDFRSPERNRFQYRLNVGDWEQLSGNVLTLAGLPSGEHSIEIKGSNSDGEWSPHHAFASIAVVQPWYLQFTTILILSSSFILLMLLLTIIFVIRLRSQSHVQSLLKNDLASHTKAVTLLEKNIRKIHKIAVESPVQSTLIKDIIALSEPLKDTQERDIPKDLMTDTLSLGLTYLTEEMASQYQITLTLTNEFDDSIVEKEVANDFYRVLFEILTTLIEHRDATLVDVKVRWQNNRLWAFVNGDWDRRDPLQGSVNVDLHWFIAKNIMAKYSGSIDTSKKADGMNSVTISLPVPAK